MEPNELKIGNIIKVRDNGRWNTAMVTAIFQSFIIAKNRFIHVGNTYDPHQTHGAILDEDWLYDNDFHIYQLSDGSCAYELPDNKKPNSLSILAENDGTFSIILVESKSLFTRLTKQFRYFHELQNLYSSITGKELFNENELKPILSMAAPTVDTYSSSD